MLFLLALAILLATFTFLVEKGIVSFKVGVLIFIAGYIAIAVTIDIPVKEYKKLTLTEVKEICNKTGGEVFSQVTPRDCSFIKDTIKE